MFKKISMEDMINYINYKGGSVEEYNYDIVLALSQITNSVEKGYNLYINQAYEGYSLSYGKASFESIKKDIIYRNKEQFPIKFLYESSKEKFIETVSSLSGMELCKYLVKNGWYPTDIGVSICIAEDNL